MYSVFENLPEEKRNKIQTVAIKEFSEQGFENASTNTIVKEAGISKGILFHYFKTKKDLYQYLIFQSVEKLYTRMMEETEFESTDYFERMVETSRVKLKFFLENPEEYLFISRALKESRKEIMDALYERYMPLIGGYFAKLNTGMDMSKFREGTDIGKVNEIVTWVMEGLSDRMAKDLPVGLDEVEGIVEKAILEFLGYVEILKMGMYRE